MSVLALAFLTMPSIDVIEKVEQAVQTKTVSQQPPVLGSLAER
jgi:hypothetical protein